MSSSQAQDYRLYGTSQPPAEGQQVAMLDLTFVAEGAQLRRFCVDQREIMRSVGLVIRDEFWGTHHLLQQHLETRSEHRQWWRKVEGIVASNDDKPVLDWRLEMDIRGDRLSIKAELSARRDFSTCRAGLMLLHPLDGVVGAPVSVIHSDNQQEEGVFPDLISASQPFFDIAGLVHSPAPGLVLDWRLSGDVFEMEDQRNWSDASFKTYNRPLALPCPYVIEAGQRVEQRIELTVLRNQDYRP